MLNMIYCNEYSTALICLAVASSIAVLLHHDLCVIIFFSFFIYRQFITNSGFRICVKELFVQRFDPLTVSYAVLSGRQEHFLFSTVVIN